MRMVGSLGVMDIIETEPGFQNPNILQALSRMQSGTHRNNIYWANSRSSDGYRLTPCVSTINKEVDLLHQVI